MNEALEITGHRQVLKLADFWQARPGPNDLEAKQKYYRPYLSKTESELAFYRLECGLPFKDISKRQHRKEATLRKLWQRTKKKIFAEHSKQP